MVAAEDFAEDQRSRLRLRFGAVADIYDRARPGYAPAAIEWALAGHRRVLDLAAGTGKLTAGVIELGREVVAIDPSEPMLAVLHAKFPSVEVRVGSAEAIGLPAGSVDAVVIGSALHWFERPAADAEIARVLAPGGAGCGFRNRRDTSVAWVAALEQLIDQRTAMRRVHHSELRRATALDAAWFGPAETAEFAFSESMTGDRLAELYASRSYVIDLDDAARANLLAEIREFARTHPDLAGRAVFELPYQTVVTRQGLLRS
jgi:ubiquinone/menaquinone biosynthesis C-methylase UbiE